MSTANELQTEITSANCLHCFSFSRIKFINYLYRVYLSIRLNITIFAEERDSICGLVTQWISILALIYKAPPKNHLNVVPHQDDDDDGCDECKQ